MSHALNSMPGIFYMLDRDMNFILWNSNFERELGYSGEEIRELDYKVFVRDEDLEQLNRRVQKVWNRGAATLEMDLIAKDGSTHPYYLIASKITRNGDDFLIGSGIDISVRLKAERELHQSEQRWARLVQKNPGLVQLSSSDGKILFLNPAGAGIYGKDDPEELIGNNWSEYLSFDDPVRLERRKQQVLDGEQVKPEIFRIHTWDDRELYLELQSTRIDYKNEKVLLNIGNDVTQRIRYQQILKRSLAEKEVLLQEIHHRVKNNLAIITGLLELQGAEVGDPEARRILENSKRRIFSIAKVHELLYQHEELDRIEFSRYIRKLTNTMDQLSRTDEKQISIEYQLENVYLNIEQAIPCGMVMNELITNAVKHAFAGKTRGTITIGLREQDSIVHLSIRDDGVGMNDFDINEQGSLGVTIIKLLVEQLNAELQYEGNDGSHFELTFKKKGYSGPLRKSNDQITD